MNALTSIVAAAECRLDDPTPLDAMVQVGLVRLWGRDLAIPAEFVREVVPLPQDVQPAFARADALAGSIVVRGQVIPVVNVSHLLGFETGEPGPGAVVVLRRERDLVGLFVHAVSGLTSVRAGDIQPYVFNGGGHAPVVASSFTVGDRLVGVIDTAAILSLPGVPRAREVSRIGRNDLVSGQRRILVLSVGGAELALEATFVVATVPATQVRPAPEVGNQWVGVIDYLELEVPVIDDIALLGLSGRASGGRDSLVIILRLADNQLIGIKADRVHRIMSVREREIRPLPRTIAGQLPLFTGSVGDGNGGQSLLLSSAALSADAALLMIAALTQRKHRDRPTDAVRGSDKGAAALVTPRPYLVFRAGTRHRACALADIAQIVPLPENYSALTCPGSQLCGFISHSGAPVALIDLGTGSGEHSEGGRMVLIVTAAECATGFIVDQLDTIAHARPQPTPPSMRAAGEDDAFFIQARIGGKDQAVLVSALESELTTSTAPRDEIGQHYAHG